MTIPYALAFAAVCGVIVWIVWWAMDDWKGALGIFAFISFWVWFSWVALGWWGGR